MLTKVAVDENNNMFSCEKCDYKTSRKSSFDKHLMTAKHSVNATFNTKVAKSCKNIFYTCEICNKKYKSRVGLWGHKKKCTTIITEYGNENETEKEDLPENENNSTTENTTQMDMLINLFQEQLKENKELKELIIEQQKKILEMGVSTNITNNNNITQNNNKFNLNVFLNETCKDALNLSDFLESLILTLTDFENFGPLGYCGGISNILVKGLNNLDISKRPIHCSDLKREVIHIKNNDTWHKDEDKQQMIKAIKAIEHKNVKQMSLWAKANPEYKDPNHKKSDLYTKLIDQSLGETDKEKALKNYNKIIRTVAKEVLVDKDK
jgi:hypothetical protein|uniref:C2H2-type domain-containing protein n=1 Tax=viral metagenome TaxID=1070528 RepID=A0A6C0DG99_9ZZZZ